MDQRVINATQKVARSGCSQCQQSFSSQANRDRHLQSDHPTDASGSYIPVQRYQPQRSPASGRKLGPQGPAKGTGPSWFEQNPIGQIGQHRKPRWSTDAAPDGGLIGLIGQSALGHAPGPSTGVETASVTRSITTLDPSATGPADVHTLLPDQGALDHPPTSHPLANNPLKKHFQCKTCLVNFPTKKDRKTHRKSIHPQVRGFRAAAPSADGPPVCMNCNRDFPTRNALDLHLLNSPVHAVRHYCRICTMHFFTPGAVVVHSFIAHGLELPCDKCTLWFATEEERAVHVVCAHPESESVVAPRPAPPIWAGGPSASITSDVWSNLFNPDGPKHGRGPRSRKDRAGALIDFWT